MKSQKLIDLKRDRAEIVQEARDCLNDIKDCTDDKTMRELEKKHDGLMNKFSLIELDIQEEKFTIEEETEARAKRPNGDGSASAADDGGYSIRTAGWQDKDGKEVRCLTPRQRFATERPAGPSLGQLMRAMITGPRNDAERRALSEGTDSAGGFTVPTPLAAEFIDALRAKSVLIQAGARTVDMSTATLAMAKLATDPQAAWTAENASVTESDATFAKVTLEAKKLLGVTRLSRELAEDSTNINQMLENAFTQAVALQFDYAGLYGTGSSSQPTGIVNQAGINSVSMGTNGAALANYDNLIDTIYENQVNNAADPTAMIWHPRTGVALAKLKDADGNPMSVPEMVANVPKLSTTSIPIDETQGTATNASSVISGDFTQMIVGLRNQMRIRLLTETYAANDQYAFMFGLRGDFALAQPKAFTRLVGVKP